jgi:hypothetical protein
MEGGYTEEMQQYEKICARKIERTGERKEGKKN